MIMTYVPAGAGATQIIHVQGQTLLIGDRVLWIQWHITIWEENIGSGVKQLLHHCLACHPHKPGTRYQTRQVPSRVGITYAFVPFLYNPSDISSSIRFLSKGVCNASCISKVVTLSAALLQLHQNMLWQSEYSLLLILTLVVADDPFSTLESYRHSSRVSLLKQC